MKSNGKEIYIKQKTEFLAIMDNVQGFRYGWYNSGWSELWFDKALVTFKEKCEKIKDFKYVMLICKKNGLIKKITSNIYTEEQLIDFKSQFIGCRKDQVRTHVKEIYKGEFKLDEDKVKQVRQQLNTANENAL